MTTARYLFLDDERMPEQVTWRPLPRVAFVIVRNYRAFTHYITQHGIPAFITFDNDLGEGEPEGRDCAHWLINRVLDGDAEFPISFEYDVHSKNNVAEEAIRGLFDNYFRVFGR